LAGMRSETTLAEMLLSFLTREVAADASGCGEI
jgi:hypothetical protein